MSFLAPLAPLRAHAGTRLTDGLDDATVQRLAATHPALGQAIEAAAAEYAHIKDDFAELLEAAPDGRFVCLAVLGRDTDTVIRSVRDVLAGTGATLTRSMWT